MQFSTRPGYVASDNWKLPPPARVARRSDAVDMAHILLPHDRPDTLLRRGFCHDIRVRAAKTPDFLSRRQH